MDAVAVEIDANAGVLGRRRRLPLEVTQLDGKQLQRLDALLRQHQGLAGARDQPRLNGRGVGCVEIQTLPAQCQRDRVITAFEFAKAAQRAHIELALGRKRNQFCRPVIDHRGARCRCRGGNRTADAGRNVGLEPAQHAGITAVTAGPVLNQHVAACRHPHLVKVVVDQPAGRQHMQKGTLGRVDPDCVAHPVIHIDPSIAVGGDVLDREVLPSITRQRRKRGAEQRPACNLLALAIQPNQLVRPVAIHPDHHATIGHRRNHAGFAQRKTAQQRTVRTQGMDHHLLSLGIAPEGTETAVLVCPQIIEVIQRLLAQRILAE